MAQTNEKNEKVLNADEKFLDYLQQSTKYLEHLILKDNEINNGGKEEISLTLIIVFIILIFFLLLAILIALITFGCKYYRKKALGNNPRQEASVIPSHISSSPKTSNQQPTIVPKPVFQLHPQEVPSDNKSMVQLMECKTDVNQIPKSPNKITYLNKTINAQSTFFLQLSICDKL